MGQRAPAWGPSPRTSVFARLARHHRLGTHVAGVTYGTEQRERESDRYVPRRAVCATSSICNHAAPLTGRSHRLGHTETGVQVAASDTGSDFSAGPTKNWQPH